MAFKRGHHYSGFLFSFEGGEGSGKSTQISQLQYSLKDLGNNVMIVREPGGTDIGEQIRHILQYSKRSEAMTPETEILLFEASRAQLIREVIAPALEKGNVVLADRLHDSTTAYQGVGRKIDPYTVNFLNNFAIGNVRPDITFLFDLDPQIGLKRARGRELFDRMENQALDFFTRVRQGYLSLASQEPERFRIIDATQNQKEIETQLRKYVFDFMAHPPTYKGN